MGLMVNGVWSQENAFPTDSGGHFVRPSAPIRNWITADGAPGPSGEGGFKAEKGRYHLYVSLACPWAHRTLIFRKLKGLEDMIGLSVVHWHMAENGWTFEDGPGVIPDPVLSRPLPSSDLYSLAARLYRPRHGARALGPRNREDRQQRILRNHPHVQFRVRRRRRGAGRFLSRAAARARSTR